MSPLVESIGLLIWYVREHLLLCLVPAFFIAGALTVYADRGAITRYLGSSARKIASYPVAAISGTVLAVCSCTVLPLFAGIHRMGAGLGPATTFLYAGPAINVLAIILTARVLGLELGIARAIGAIAFSMLIGLLMHLLFRGEERDRATRVATLPADPAERPIRQTLVLLGAMLAILVLATWARPDGRSGVWSAIHDVHWALAGLAAVGLAIVLVRWFSFPRLPVLALGLAVVLAAAVIGNRPEPAFLVAIIGLTVIMATRRGQPRAWIESTWGYARQIVPLLVVGILVAGFLLGRPGHEGLIPSVWIERAVGGNSVAANAFASVAGALMYFATLTEIPILDGLLGNGMGKGPALALLLAGPAVSLPNMLVIRSVMGTPKTLVFVGLVIVMATISGLIYGAL